MRELGPGPAIASPGGWATAARAGAAEALRQRRRTYPSAVESQRSSFGSRTSGRVRSSGRPSMTTTPGVLTDGALMTSSSVLGPAPFQRLGSPLISTVGLAALMVWRGRSGLLLLLLVRVRVRCE